MAGVVLAGVALAGVVSCGSGRGVRRRLSRVETRDSSSRMPSSAAFSTGPGGVMTARTRLPIARSASAIISLADAWRSLGFLAMPRAMTSSSAWGSSGR